PPRARWQRVWPRGEPARSPSRAPAPRGAPRVPGAPADGDPRPRRLVRVARHLAVRLSHHDTPGRPGGLRLARTRSAVTISGASMVTSPAPMVTTTSPGAVAAATASATEEKSGRYCTGTLTCSATLAPLTPARGCSRAP